MTAELAEERPVAPTVYAGATVDAKACRALPMNGRGLLAVGVGGGWSNLRPGTAAPPHEHCKFRARRNRAKWASCSNTRIAAPGHHPQKRIGDAALSATKNHRAQAAHLLRCLHAESTAGRGTHQLHGQDARRRPDHRLRWRRLRAAKLWWKQSRAATSGSSATPSIWERASPPRTIPRTPWCAKSMLQPRRAHHAHGRGRNQDLHHSQRRRESQDVDHRATVRPQYNLLSPQSRRNDAHRIPFRGRSASAARRSSRFPKSAYIATTVSLSNITPDLLTSTSRTRR